VIGAGAGGLPGVAGVTKAAFTQPRPVLAATPRLPNAGTGGLLDRRQDALGAALRFVLLGACCLALGGLALRNLRRA